MVVCHRQYLEVHVVDQKPIGVSSYRVTRELPAPLQEDLPSIEDLQGVVEKLRGEFDAVRSAEESEAEGEDL
jgi:hypothetical protein